MTALYSTVLSFLLLLYSISNFVRLLRFLTDATTAIVEEARDEYRLRQCAGQRAQRLNLEDSARFLARVSPSKANAWTQALGHLTRQVEDYPEISCISKHWRAEAHHELNPSVPPDWPNWRPRFAQPTPSFGIGREY